MRRVLSLTAVVVGLGCGGPPTGVHATPRLTLAVEPAGVEGASGSRRARLTIRNEGGRAVALSGCPRPPAVRIERREGGAWREAGSYGLICLGIHSFTTTTLLAGSRIETVVTAGPAGRYRFVVPVGADETAPGRELRSAVMDLP